MYDVLQGMRIAELRSTASGRRAYQGFGDLTTSPPSVVPEEIANDARNTVADASRGAEADLVLQYQQMKADKGGVLPDGAPAYSPGDGAAITEASGQFVPAPSMIDRFNAMPTASKVGVGVGVVALTGAIFWLVKG